MSRWIVESASPLIPLLNLKKENITGYDIDSMDATTLQVLYEPGRLATTKSYVYYFRGGGPKRESIIYEYNQKNHKAFVKRWFYGFTGYVHSDADSFFGDFYAQDHAVSSLCNLHSRRKFEAISKQSKKEDLSHHIMMVYAQL